MSWESYTKMASLVELLEPGRHYYRSSNSVVQVHDMRQKNLTLGGQEILTKDNLSIKISLSATYQIVDLVKALNSSENYLTQIYNACQIGLRKITAGYTLDEVLADKNAINTAILEKMQVPAEAIGLKFTMLAIKDIMLPAQIKQAYSATTLAKHEALKQLESARGEQAVLRKLANFSSMFDEHPSLLQARLIQAISQTNGNSIVFGTGETKPEVKKKKAS